MVLFWKRRVFCASVVVLAKGCTEYGGGEIVGSIVGILLTTLSDPYFSLDFAS